jgi:hypothetical protein
VLTNYYEAYCGQYAKLHKVCDQAGWIEKSGVVTRVKDMTARFMDNLTANILKDFERDAKNQLENANLDNMHQLLYEIRDEAIKKFEKLEKGLYDIHYSASGPT